MSRYRNQVKNLSGLLGLESYGRSYSHYSLEELEEAIAEDDAAIQETQSELDSASDTMNDLTADAETVDNVGAIVEDSIESGEGLSEPAAALVQEAVESIMRRHGVARRYWPNLPSKETFSSSRSRLEASRRLKVSIEEGIFQKIWKGIKNLWEKIKGFFKKIWDSLFGKSKKTEKVVEETQNAVQGAIDAGHEESEVSEGEISEIQEAAAQVAEAAGQNVGEEIIENPSEAVKVIKQVSEEDQQLIIESEKYFNDYITGRMSGEAVLARIKEDNRIAGEAKFKVTSKTVKLKKILGELETLKIAIGDYTATGKKFNDKNEKTVDDLIDKIQKELNTKRGDGMQAVILQNLLNHIKSKKEHLLRTTKALVTFSDKYCKVIGTNAKAKKDFKDSANVIRENTYEKSNRRFGSFRRYSR